MPTKKTFTESEMIVKLHTKIENCSLKIGHQTKDGKNDFANFSFTSNEQMMAAVRAAWPEVGLSVTNSLVSHSEQILPNCKKLTIRTTVVMNFTITDLETGYQIKSDFPAAEQCTQGKSMQKAITSAFKYWIFKTFKVSSKMEKDPDSEADEISAIEEAVYYIQNAESIDDLKSLHAKYSHLGKAVTSELTNRKKQLQNG